MEDIGRNLDSQILTHHAPQFMDIGLCQTPLDFPPGTHCNLCLDMHISLMRSMLLFCLSLFFIYINGIVLQMLFQLRYLVRRPELRMVGWYQIIKEPTPWEERSFINLFWNSTHGHCLWS